MQITFSNFGRVTDGEVITGGADWYVVVARDDVGREVLMRVNEKYDGECEATHHGWRAIISWLPSKHAHRRVLRWMAERGWRPLG